MKTLLDRNGNFMFTFDGDIDLSLPEYSDCTVVDGTLPLAALDEQADDLARNEASVHDEHESELDDLIVRMAALEQRVLQLESNN